ncbi:hypothetical protein [Candidatus Pelagibacter communis]|uniref:hypothetical protein n=1 Tax=Pelagibacter ubique TaxID=198252 RepID=UPI000A666A06|nr:hypothetical protein [Candidatus Pelagibacter ubique]
MRTLQRYFSYNHSLYKVDEYISLVLKNIDPNNKFKVIYEDLSESHFRVKITIFDKVLN